MELLLAKAQRRKDNRIRFAPLRLCEETSFKQK